MVFGRSEEPEKQKSMKYIVTTNEDLGEEIFTFPDSVGHNIMAEAVCAMRNQTHGNWKRIKRETVSAGFVEPSGGCVGRSESLGISSRPQDTELLAAMKGAPV